MWLSDLEVNEEISTRRKGAGEAELANKTNLKIRVMCVWWRGMQPAKRHVFPDTICIFTEMSFCYHINSRCHLLKCIIRSTQYLAKDSPRRISSKMSQIIRDIFSCTRLSLHQVRVQIRVHRNLDLKMFFLVKSKPGRESWFIYRPILFFGKGRAEPAIHSCFIYCLSFAGEASTKEFRFNSFI